MKWQPIVDLLELNDFILVRQNNHCVWKHPQGMTFVHAATPSDHRAQLNMEKDLRRIMNERGLTMITEKQKKEKEPMQSQFNPPKTIIVSPSAPKLLNEGTVPLLEELIAKGKTINEVVIILGTMGYRTPTGLTVTRPHVDSLLSRVRLKAQGKVVTKRTPKKSEDKLCLTELTEILSSNLSDELKKRVLNLIISEAV